MAINETATVFSTLLDFMTKVTGTLKVLVGGVFGLYIILLFVKWVEYKKLVRLLVGIKKEMRDLNNKLGGKIEERTGLIDELIKRTLGNKFYLKKKPSKKKTVKKKR